MTEQNEVDDEVVDIEPYEGEPDELSRVREDGSQDDEEANDA